MFLVKCGTRVLLYTLVVNLWQETLVCDKLQLKHRQDGLRIWVYRWWYFLLRVPLNLFHFMRIIFTLSFNSIFHYKYIFACLCVHCIFWVYFTWFYSILNFFCAQYCSALYYLFEKKINGNYRPEINRLTAVVVT